MLRRFHLFLPLFLVLAAGTGPLCGTEKTEHWPQLKLGMTAEETLAALGSPMLRTSGRGFETWIYDNGAEVLLFGSLIGWTAPNSGRVANRSQDIWQNAHDGIYFPTFLSRLPQPIKRLPRPNETLGHAGDDGYWIPTYRYRQ